MTTRRHVLKLALASAAVTTAEAAIQDPILGLVMPVDPSVPPDKISGRQRRSEDDDTPWLR
jgi:hypothetical protein